MPPAITFSDNDPGSTIPGHDKPMLISTIIANVEIRRVLVDQVSLVDILFYEAFMKMQFKERHLRPYNANLISSTSNRFIRKGYIETHITLGQSDRERTENVTFAGIDIPSAYNDILGMPMLNAFGVVIATRQLVMKFLNASNQVVSIHGNQQLTKSCYNVSLNLNLRPLSEGRLRQVPLKV